MYKKSFYIDGEVGNNAFSFGERRNKKLYVPSLIEINSFDDIKLGEKIVFEDFDSDGKLHSCKGSNNFYEIKWQGKKIYLFDNHNHAFYFWYLARNNGVIRDNNILYHVDEHSDMRDPGEYLMKPDSFNMQRVFEYTNFAKVNVGNYIVPAIKEGLIGEVIQIRNEDNLLTYLSSPSPSKERGLGGEVVTGEGKGIMLNLDLDFFQKDLDFIDYELKKKVILDIAKKADLITVATSPFFIDQRLALKVFKDLFS